MRIRRKPWARPELAACPYYIQEPHTHKNRWRAFFANPEQPLHLELGCGKGGFIAQMAPANPQINYLAIDIKSEMLGLARRKVEAAYAERGLEVKNFGLMSQEIELIHGVFGPEDGVQRIYINFCNPWSRAGYQKRRLTHSRQLIKYAGFLADGAEIWFKTDDDGLFEDSLLYFEECGFVVEYKTYDLHNSGFEGSLPTEHEMMFTAEGIPTKFLIARFDRTRSMAAIEKLLEENPKYHPSLIVQKQRPDRN